MPLPQFYYDKWNQIRNMTTNLVDIIPDDADYMWKPHADMKSLGELIAHIMVADYLVLNKFFEKKSEIPTILKNGPHNKKSLFPYLEESSSHVKTLFNSLSATDLSQELTPGKNDWTSEKVIRHLEDHEIHHAAQLKMYLKLLNIDTNKIKFCK